MLRPGCANFSTLLYPTRREEKNPGQLLLSLCPFLEMSGGGASSDSSGSEPSAIDGLLHTLLAQIRDSNWLEVQQKAAAEEKRPSLSNWAAAGELSAPAAEAPAPAGESRSHGAPAAAAAGAAVVAARSEPSASVAASAHDEGALARRPHAAVTSSAASAPPQAPASAST